MKEYLSVGIILTVAMSSINQFVRIALLVASATTSSWSQLPDFHSRFISLTTHLFELSGPYKLYEQLPAVNNNAQHMYWFDKWCMTSIHLKGESIAHEAYLTRYDLFNNQFEFQFWNDIRMLKADKIKDVVWIEPGNLKKHFLINLSELNVEGDRPEFAEVLVDGEVCLLKKVSSNIIDPNYNVALSVGHKEARVSTKTEYYCLVNNELIRIKSRKSLPDILEKVNHKAGGQYVKSRMKSEADLVSYFQHLTDHEK